MPAPPAVAGLEEDVDTVSDDEDNSPDSSDHCQHADEDALFTESVLLAAFEDLATQEGSVSFWDALEYCYKSVALQSEPKTLGEALKRPDGDRWYRAAAEEMSCDPRAGEGRAAGGDAERITPWGQAWEAAGPVAEWLTASARAAARGGLVECRDQRAGVGGELARAADSG